MKKHIFTWHLNVSQLQFSACTRDDGRYENVRGMGSMWLTLMEGHLIEQVLLICKFAQNTGGWGNCPLAPLVPPALQVTY